MRFDRKLILGDPNGCWLWGGYVDRITGYGSFNGTSAHRFAYETFTGPIPEGKEIDHLCRVRECCNPRHLEPVTRSENLRRRVLNTHCPEGHPYTVYVRANGYRNSVCCECRRETNRIRMARWRAHKQNQGVS